MLNDVTQHRTLSTRVGKRGFGHSFSYIFFIVVKRIPYLSPIMKTFHLCPRRNLNHLTFHNYNTELKNVGNVAFILFFN